MVVRKVLLHSVISQMYLWLETMHVELIWRRSYITFFIPVGSRNTKNISNQHIMSDIKLPVIIQKRPVDIHLHNKCTLLSLLFCLTVYRNISWSRRSLQVFMLICIWSARGLFHDRVQLVYLVNHSYSSTLVRIFTRFDYPYIPGLLLRTVSFLFFLLLILNQLASLLMILAKPQILRVFHPILNVKSHRHILKDILLYQRVIFFQVVK